MKMNSTLLSNFLRGDAGVVVLAVEGAFLLEGTTSLFCQSGVFDVFMYINPRPKPATMRRIRLMV